MQRRPTCPAYFGYRTLVCVCEGEGRCGCIYDCEKPEVTEEQMMHVEAEVEATPKGKSCQIKWVFGEVCSRGRL